MNFLWSYSELPMHSYFTLVVMCTLVNVALFHLPTAYSYSHACDLSIYEFLHFTQIFINLLANSSVMPSQSMSRLNPANLTSWSVEDVSFWLVSQGLGNFMDTFKDNEVDGECLLTLDNQLLKDDLCITALGHRSRILKRVEALKNEFLPKN